MNENDSFHDEADESQPLKVSLLEGKPREESKKAIDFNVDEDEEAKIGGPKKVEPTSHVEARNICEKIFPKLAEGTKLTPGELEVFYQFKSKLVQPYDQVKAEHEVRFALDDHS
jgi:hypothetical protein